MARNSDDKEKASRRVVEGMISPAIEKCYRRQNLMGCLVLIGPSVFVPRRLAQTGKVLDDVIPNYPGSRVAY